MYLLYMNNFEIGQIFAFLFLVYQINLHKPDEQ